MGENLYAGSNYGLDPNYGINTFNTQYGGFSGYRIGAGSLGFPSNPDSSNQVKAVSDKLNTGATTIEVSGVNIGMVGRGHMDLIEAIPKQQFKEIDRLRQLTGAKLSFHGPLIELSGIGEGPWQEIDRQRSEREMWSTVEKAHQIDSDKGNVPIVFHTSNVPETEDFIKDPVTGEIIVKDGYVIDQETGSHGRLPMDKADYFASEEGKKLGFKENVKKYNEKQWTQRLQSLSFSAHQAMGGVKQAKDLIELKGDVPESVKKSYLELYKEYVKDYNKFEEKTKHYSQDEKAFINRVFGELTYSDNYTQNLYNELNDLYNNAYAVAKRSNPHDKKILDDFRKEAAKKMQEYKEDPSKVEELGNLIFHGVTTLRKIDAPQTFEPIKDFMKRKTAETVSNVAFKAYEQWKDKAPIIALENPPANKFAFSRAEDIKALVDESRNQFRDKAMASGMSKSEAEKAAEKFIGVTWDTAHINTLKAKGYSNKDVLKQTKEIAPYVKHIHISDNFGLADEELPPGWGTSPIPEQLKLIEKYNKDAKKIVETGSWYSALKFRHTPMMESLSAFGSPVYAMKMAPYWNQAAVNFGGYYSGIGPTNPDWHHRYYGAGFSNLPIAMGGQMEGQSRMGGAPME